MLYGFAVLIKSNVFFSILGHEKILPMILYKYSGINKNSLSGLIHRKLWCAGATSFNDPFEFRIVDTSSVADQASDIENILKRFPEMSSFGPDKLQKSLTQILKEIFTEKLGVVVFSENNNSPLMWAHYGDNHYGMCLGFQVDKPGTAKIFKVSYQDTYPAINVLDVVANLDDFKKIKAAFKNITTVKSTDWNYEQEWRQIIPDVLNCLHPYPGQLSSVIFGSRARNTDKELVMKVLENHPVKFYQASLHSSEFQVLINDL